MPPCNPKVSVIIPCLNEERNLADTVSSVQRAATVCRKEIEIIVVNDGSTDRTGPIASQLINRVIHHSTTLGLGKSFLDGVSQACGQYVVMIPGDNAFEESSVTGLFSKIGAADFINTYIANLGIRPQGRRLLSRLYTLLVRWLSGVSLHYFNGPTVYKRALLKDMQQCNGFGYNAELLTGLIGRSASYVEVPMKIKPQPGRRSRAFNFSNWMSVGKSLLKIFLRRFTIKESCSQTILK